MSQEVAPNRRRKPWAWPVEAREDRCPICLDRVADTVRALPCRHIFCRECTEQWTANSPSCPLCRQRILAKQRLDWRPSAVPPTCSPQGKLQRTRERWEARCARRSRSVPPRSPPRSRSTSPCRLVRSSSWRRELNQRSRFEELPPQNQDREWLRRVAREWQMDAGEHARHPDGPPFSRRPSLPCPAGEDHRQLQLILLSPSDRPRSAHSAQAGAAATSDSGTAWSPANSGRVVEEHNISATRTALRWPSWRPQRRRGGIWA